MAKIKELKKVETLSKLPAKAVADKNRSLSSYPGTKILPCTCIHEDQDKMYGKGRRVHNRIETKGKFVGYACTVCTPRALTCERNGTQIDAAPAFGMKVQIPAKRPRYLKQG